MILSEYKWVYDRECQYSEEYYNADKTKMVRIERLIKVPMTAEDYKKAYKRGVITKTEYHNIIVKLKLQNG